MKHMHDLDIHSAWHLLDKYIEAEMSAGYLDTVKDRMYCEDVQSTSRKAAQTVLVYLLREFLTMLGPVVPSLVAEAWSHAPETITQVIEHPLRRQLEALPEEWEAPELNAMLPGLGCAAVQ